MATALKPQTLGGFAGTGALTSVKDPVKSPKFESKAARKAKRKALIKKFRQAPGSAANGMIDTQLNARARAQFYRNLRKVKMNRRAIAAALAAAADRMAWLRRDVVRVPDVVRGVDIGRCDETLNIVKNAEIALKVAACEFHAFSRAKVFYAKGGSR